MRSHERAFGDIKNYYNDITLNNLALINSLKEQVQEMKQKEERMEKMMAEVMAENKRLVEPLQAAKQRVAELERQLTSYEADKESLRNAKVQLKLKGDEISQLKWELEVLQQRFGDTESERDELYDRFVKSIYDVQQKAGFKNLLLERKLKALAEQLEAKEAQLNEVLAAANLDPTALAVVTAKLEDVLDGKNAAIRDLEYELARMCKAYNDVVMALQAKLKEHGIPVEELGFSLLPVDPQQPLGRAPAGLVATSS
jgi:DNA repair exonuclease SbcCD ATPase subunit